MGIISLRNRRFLGTTLGSVRVIHGCRPLRTNQVPVLRLIQIWFKPIGVTIYFRAPSDAELSIRTSQGTTSFSPADIVEPEGIPLLGHRVEAHRTPVVKPITDAEFEDDFPSLTSDGDTLWMAWQGFKDDGDLVFLRRYSQGGWGQRMTLSESPADVFRTAVAAVQGKALVVWSERQGKDWHLKARFHDGSASNKTEIITSGATQNLFHSVAGGRNGEFHVAYQSWRRRRSDIYFRSYAGNQWGPEIKLSDPSRGERENDWRPVVVSDHDGTVWVAWDSYAKGSYNILLRAVRDGKPGALIRVADSRRFPRECKSCCRFPKPDLGRLGRGRRELGERPRFSRGRRHTAL